MLESKVFYPPCSCNDRHVFPPPETEWPVYCCTTCWCVYACMFARTTKGKRTGFGVQNLMTTKSEKSWPPHSLQGMNHRARLIPMHLTPVFRLLVETLVSLKGMCYLLRSPWALKNYPRVSGGLPRRSHPTSRRLLDYLSKKRAKRRACHFTNWWMETSLGVRKWRRLWDTHLTDERIQLQIAGIKRTIMPGRPLRLDGIDSYPDAHYACR